VFFRSAVIASLFLTVGVLVLSCWFIVPRGGVVVSVK